MAWLPLLPEDIVAILCSMLRTRELVNLSYVVSIPECAWTTHVRRRCGPRWVPGIEGLQLLMRAAYGPVALAVPDTRSVAVSCFGSYMALPGGLPGNMHGMCVTCLAVVNENTIAAGHDYGFYIYGPVDMKSVWLEARANSIACVGLGCIWVSTNQHVAFEYDLRSETLVRIAAGRHVYCVSGPVGVLGTGTGTWPLVSPRTIACTHIVQSDVQIAAWHVSGDISVLCACTGLPLHMIATGGTQYLGASVLSIIGDIIRVAGRTWSGGRCTGSCPRDCRHVSPDGRIIYA